VKVFCSPIIFPVFRGRGPDGSGTSSSIRQVMVSELLDANVKTFVHDLRSME